MNNGSRIFQTEMRKRCVNRTTFELFKNIILNREWPVCLAFASVIGANAK